MFVFSVLVQSQGSFGNYIYIILNIIYKRRGSLYIPIYKRKGKSGKLICYVLQYVYLIGIRRYNKLQSQNESRY